jgi:hypothetical protein
MVLTNQCESVYLQKGITTVNNHQVRLAVYLRSTIVLMLANTFLTVKHYWSFLRFISMYLLRHGSDTRCNTPIS